jgi:hypothetical protein
MEGTKGEIGLVQARWIMLGKHGLPIEGLSTILFLPSERKSGMLFYRDAP